MKRLLLLSSLIVVLTISLISQPPRNAGAQRRADQQDTQRPYKPLLDTIDLAQELDSNRRILTEIQGNVQGIKKGVNQLVKAKNVEHRKAAEALKAEADTVVVIDTVYRLKVVPFGITDSSMIGRTWWGQLFLHMKRCRAGKIFKPKQWRKGKF